MGAKNSKNKIKSVNSSSSPVETIQKETSDKSDLVIDDMLFFHKPESDKFVPQNKISEKIDKVSTIQHKDIYEENSLNKTSNLGKNFVQVKSRSDLSTRHIFFNKNTTPTDEDTRLNEETAKKSKYNVRFSEQVLVINSSDLDQFYLDSLNNYDSLKLFKSDRIKKYFIGLNDENLVTPKAKHRIASFKTSNKTNVISNEFDKLRSWNRIKETTFYEDEKSTQIMF